MVHSAPPTSTESQTSRSSRAEMQTWMSKQDLFDPSQRLRSFLYTGRLEWIRGHFFNDDGKEGDSDLLRTGEREREGVDHCLRELLSHGRGEDALSVLSDVSKKSCGPPRARIVFLLARILLFKNLKRESEVRQRKRKKGA